MSDLAGDYDDYGRPQESAPNGYGDTGQGEANGKGWGYGCGYYDGTGYGDSIGDGNGGGGGDDEDGCGKPITVASYLSDDNMPALLLVMKFLQGEIT